MRLNVFLIVMLSLVVNSATAHELTIPKDKEVIEFETKLGVVTFAHQKHAGLSITECKTCHHKMKHEDATVKPCNECHQHKSEDPPKTSVVFHKRCTGCHEYTVAGGQTAGPLKKKCKLCHVKPAAK